MLSFIHISDLHIGKRLHGYDLYEDQEYMLGQIAGIIEERKPDAVLIAGDIYDRTNPSEESASLLSGFLERLQKSQCEIFVIAGNHDPGEKLSFLSSVVDESGLHIRGKYTGKPEKRSVSNADIYMLPYIRMVDVRRYFPESRIESPSDAMRAVLASADIDRSRINVLVAHQAVLDAVRAGSEDSLIGGDAPISSSVFSDFDYVALGHIHKAQAIGSSNIRYSGSMLKYSASEREGKAAIYGIISDDGALSVEEIRLKPLHDIVIRKGSFSDIIASESTDDYVYAVLTDDRDIPDAAAALSSKFPRFILMEYDNKRTRDSAELFVITESEKERTPEEYFSELFEMIAKKKMSEDQKRVLDESINEIWGKE